MTIGPLLALGLTLLNKGFGLGPLSYLAERVPFVPIPPRVLIFLMLGTSFLGIATPTEGGAMGAMGAPVMAVARGRLNLMLMKMVDAKRVFDQLSCAPVAALQAPAPASAPKAGASAAQDDPMRDLPDTVQEDQKKNRASAGRCRQCLPSVRRSHPSCEARGSEPRHPRIGRDRRTAGGRKQERARRTSEPWWMVEPGGIEPPSASHRRTVLHA